MSKENYYNQQYQAAIGCMMIEEVEAPTVGEALDLFNDHIDNRIKGWDVYVDGKLRYRYDRKQDTLLSVYTAPITEVTDRSII